MPNLDQQRVYGGFRTLQGGVDMGTDPSLLDDSQAAFASNITFRGDLPITRQPWLSIPLDTELTGLFQGASCYIQGSTCVLVASISGRLYRIDPEGGIPAPVTDITPATPNPAALDFVWLFQAEKYLIVLALQQRTVIYDGASSRLAGPKQLPSGVLGLYAWGRIWMSLSDQRSFLAGDLIYGPSGSAAEGYVDAILYVTENDFLNEGGLFSVPTTSGPITAMQALATIDTSLGIGPVLVGTSNSIVSVNAPVDRTTWKNLAYPIQTLSLLDYGPLGPRFAIPINNDMWYRSIDGFRSFLIARRDTNLWGNTPMSHEVSPILGADTQDLLRFGSMILFDNHMFGTVVPRRTSSGVVHDGLAVINYDSLSTIRSKQPPIWEGLSSGLSILQLVRTNAGGVERAFAFALNEDSDTIELWELLPDGSGYYDTFRSVSDDGSLSLVRTPIQTVLETKRFVYDRLVKLMTMELYLDDIVDDISLRLLWKPDQYPAWLEWATIPLCASVAQCTIPSPEQFTCQIWRPNARTYAARIMLPTPGEECNVIAGTPVDRGYEFQFRAEGIGHFRLRKLRAHLRVLTDAQVGTCPPTSVACTTFPDCPELWTSYTIQRE